MGRDMTVKLRSFMQEIEKRQLWIVILFFIIYLIIGLLLFNDYGVSWDEPRQRDWGNEYYDLITHKHPLENFWQGKFYGPFFQIILAFQENLLHLQDTRDIYLSFHLTTFFYFFISVIFFYLIAQKIFGKWKYSLLACAMLILSPRIFADSFYNPKDIPLLAIFIISTYTLLLLYEKPNYLTAVVHAVTSAAAVATRIIGVMVPAITIAILIFSLFARKGETKFKYVLVSLFYLACTSGFTVLFWPVLYFEPAVFIQSFQYMRDFPYEQLVLYRGGLYHCDEIYRDYLARWISMSTPIPYSLAFIVGSFVLLYRAIRNIFKANWIKDHIAYFLLLYWFFVPFCYVYAMRPCVYSGWRHFYFIYPAFILIAVTGIEFLYRAISKATSLNTSIRNGLRYLFTTLIFLFLINVLLYLVINHPFQFVYFNRLAGSSMNEIKQNYEMDYWDVAHRQALEYLLNHDDSPLIKIIDTTTGLKYNYQILTKEERDRLYFCYPSEDPDYLITEKDDPPEEYKDAPLFYAIEVGNARILSIYKLKP
jgi:hypothetical protein